MATFSCALWSSQSGLPELLQLRKGLVCLHKHVLILNAVRGEAAALHKGRQCGSTAYSSTEIFYIPRVQSICTPRNDPSAHTQSLWKGRGGGL